MACMKGLSNNSRVYRALTTVSEASMVLNHGRALRLFFGRCLNDLAAFSKVEVVEYILGKQKMNT